MTDETTSEGPTENKPEINEPAWYLDDNTPGQGARPDWLPTKYRKASDVGRAYSELEKRLGGFTGAPDKYDVASLEIDETDPTIQTLMEVGKKHNMNQEVFQDVVGRLMSVQEVQEQAHLDDQLKKMGKDGERMLTEYKNWTKDYLQPEEREVVTNWVKTAEDLQVFNTMMAHTHMSKVPTNHTMHVSNRFESMAELKSEMAKNLDKFRNDKNYQKDWSNRMKNAYERERRG